MHNALVMQFSNADNDLRRIKLDHSFREPLLLLENLVELTSVNKWHHKVETSVRLEHVLHAAQEWMVRLKEYVFLQRSRLDLVILNQHVFSDGFNGVFLASGRKRRKVDSPESALAQLELNVEVDKIYVLQVRLFPHR